MADWRTAVCETNGIKIHYTRTGGGKLPLILLHGLTGSGPCWTAIAHALGEKYDIIMPDFRGHGKSSKPDHGYRYHDHANDIVGLVNNLGISPPVLVGHSMGGLVAAVVASHYPSLLKGIVFADPTFINAKQQREVQESDVAEQHKRLLRKSLEDLVRDIRFRHPHRSASTIEILAKARLETSMSAFEVLSPPNPDYLQLVGSIDVPSLLIIGDAGVVSADLALDLQFINAKLQVAQIRSAGHGIFYDQPDQFSAILRSFLQSFLTDASDAVTA